MSALVLKAWKVSNKPVDTDGNYVVISGRKSGLISWILSLVGIDPTTTIKVGSDRVEFHESSMSGTNNRMIPLKGVCSTYFGYHKPWKQAVGMFFVLAWLMGSVVVAIAGDSRSGGSPVGSILFVLLVSFVIALLYYFLNRTLTLGFVENSGVISGIQFKRSVIENIDVDEPAARYACELIQALIEQNVK
jgi:hypothetical protein